MKGGGGAGPSSIDVTLPLFYERMEPCVDSQLLGRQGILQLEVRGCRRRKSLVDDTRPLATICKDLLVT